jgi:protein-arginine kinase activator protein McsA
MKCSNCGAENETLVTLINAQTRKTEFICGKCQSHDAVSMYKSVAELDVAILQYEKIGKDLEDLIATGIEMPEIPEGFEQFAHSPITAFRDIQLILAALRIKRVGLMTHQDSAQRLNYELNRAIEFGDYEKAAKIRDAMKAGK